MTSKSRAAQEQLDELEKLSAPIEDQLNEAAKFLGLQLGEGGRVSRASGHLEDLSTAVPFRREEWLLIWLLKKLKSEEVARGSPSAWWLLCYIIETLPVRTAARILVTKDVIVNESDKTPKEGKTSILQQTLKDATNFAISANIPNTRLGQGEPQMVSRKRKHSGELVGSAGSAHILLGLLDAISAALSSIVKAGNTISGTLKEDSGATLSAAYMKAVITTTAEKAATLFGLWLSLCALSMPLVIEGADARVKYWFPPFSDLWESRVADDNYPMHFSLHCTRPLLSLLRLASSQQSHAAALKQDLESHVARNIILPAKEAKTSDLKSELLSILTKASVLQDSFNAPILFEVAARSVQSPDPRHRCLDDDTWLQNVFETLKNALPDNIDIHCGRSVEAMIRCAIDQKVSLELEELRQIVQQFALLDANTNWTLLSEIIRLDGNVFLIPTEGNELLEALFERLTQASLESDWSSVSESVVSQVLVPLMREFAKARDLSGFVRHWYAQLARFEFLRKEAMLFSLGSFSAWEDDLLQLEMSRLLTPSLTPHQIEQIIEWLSIQVDQNPDAVCVILDAIAGSITGQELVDKVSLSLYHVMFDNSRSEKLGSRYTWRAWRVLSQTLTWALPSDLDELTSLWKQHQKPFDSWSSKNSTSTLLESYGGDTVALDALESFRCACAAYNVSDAGSEMASFMHAVLLCLVSRLGQDLKQCLQSFGDTDGVGNDLCISRQSTLYRGIGWMLWSFIRCIFVEYPKTLCLALNLPDEKFHEMLQSVLWLSSASFDPALKKSAGWLQSNSTAFASLWTVLFEQDKVIDDKNLIGTILDTMLKNTTHTGSPLQSSEGNNAFVVHALSRIPLDTLSRSQREQVMKSWPNSTALDIGVLALKRKVMSYHPELYEGIEFKTLFEISTSMSEAKVSVSEAHVAFLKDIARLVISHTFENLDQERRQVYLTDTIKLVLRKIKRATEKKSHQLSVATIALFNVALSEICQHSTVLAELGIIKADRLSTAKSSFKAIVFSHLQNSLHSMRKSNTDAATQRIALRVIMDSIANIEVQDSDFTDVHRDAKKFIKSRNDDEKELAHQLDTFMVIYGHVDSALPISSDAVTTVQGRESVKEIALENIHRLENRQRLDILRSAFDDSEGVPLGLDKLLQLRHIASTIGDLIPIKQTSRDSSGGGTDSADERERNSFNLSNVYVGLCEQLPKTCDVLKFCLISETLDYMLKAKGRYISQYAIDATLSGISIVCSTASLSLPSTHSGTIFLHLCALIRTILTHHRLKIRGHFPILQLAMQGLLRCLFRPLPHSKTTSKSTTGGFGPTPPWLSSQTHQLTFKHAELYTRLLTLICEPSVSAVRSGKYNDLTSATESWKRMALLYMRFVLIDYINWQLEMQMLPEVRGKLVPGLYAIFDTTTVDTRRLISSELNTSGRALFAMLFRDYTKFGKWKGS